MDDIDKFFESLALDPVGLRNQFVGLSSFVNILAAALMGYLVLVVYVFSSSRPDRDKNLSMIIPVLSILMAVMMRVQNTSAGIFFGIFGILSLIRFRSNLTDQRGITFILFAVIEGLLIGLNAYLLGLLAWLVVGGAILGSRRLFDRRLVMRMTVRTAGSADEARGRLDAWLAEQRIAFAFRGSRMTVRAGKSGARKERTVLEYALFPPHEQALSAVLPALGERLGEWNYEMELRRPRD
jgi:hypothetical protein